MTDLEITALASGSGDHAELARLAEEATPGPWTDGPPAWFRGRRSEEDGKRPIQRPGHPGTMANVYGKENAAFIAAANPATVLALLAEIAALRAERDRLKLAICGREDVPGAIAAVTIEDCERFCRENHASRGDFIDRATEAERKLAEARTVIERLGSSEAFDMPCMIDGPLADEMRARMNYARNYLSKEAERG